MSDPKIIAKVNELIAAPTVCAPLKAAAEEYVKSEGSASAREALVKSLNETVSTIDETIAFAESDRGKKVFGEEMAAGMAKKGHEVKESGGKYCFCPACQAGSELYDMLKG